MIQHLGIVANLEKRGVADAVQACVGEATTQGLGVLLAEPLAEALALPGPRSPEEEMVREVDAVVALGGDGTFLRVARLVGGHGTPLLGINLGSLGFLAEIRQEEIPQAFEEVARGDYRLERRMKLEVALVRAGAPRVVMVGLNDAVLNMGPTPRALDLEVRVGETHLGRYLADGLIVATPTGSTAYCLSAGGPIVDPSVDALVLTAICPHTLGVRPLLLDHRRNVEVVLRGESGRLSVDGQVFHEVLPGDRIQIRRATEVSYFLRLPRRDFFRIIHEKLDWGRTRRTPREASAGSPGGGGSPDAA